MRLRFGTQLRLSMLVAALVPLAAFGTLAISRVQQTISADAEARVSAGSAAVQAILARDGAALLTTVQSYAGWDVLADEVAADDDAAISDQVLDFQVGGGEVDVAVLLVGEADLVASGPPAETAGLAAALGRLDDATANDGQVGLVPLADGVYQVAVERVDLGSRTGPGIEAAGTAGARLAFGRRLGPALALDARKLTGFDIAIFDVRGQPLLAGDLPTAKGFAPATPPPAGRLTLEHDGSAVAGLETLRGTDGAVIGTLATITDLGVLGAVSDAVLPVLAIALGLAAILALALALYLGERLRGRVAALETGIRQVAAGDLSVRLPADGRDELAELAASHNRLAAALERREWVLRESHTALAALRPDLGPDEVARRGVAEASRIFGLRTARLADRSRGSIAVPCGAGDRARWLVGEPAKGDGAEGPAGSGTDMALLEGYARQLGAAIEDATRYGAAAQRAEELDRLSRLQADFLRGVSHSLQTPLTKILALSEDLIDAPAEGGFVRERARVVQAEARRLARLVGQVLTLSRLEAGAYRPEEELCALLSLARRVWAGLGDGRRLVVEDVSAGALAVADRSAVEQILWVLFDNAMRYAPEGPVGFGLTLETAPQADGQARGAWLRARVMDRGPGVPEPERERIFGRFERGTSGEGQPGTGLGLGVARGLAEALRGQLDHEPRPGGGSIFTLSLPAEVPVAET